MTKSMSEIVSGVHEIMCSDFEIEAERLIPSAELGADLELDSLDAVDLVVAIEKRFGCRINEEEARSLKTLGDIHEAIGALVKREHETRDPVGG